MKPSRHAALLFWVRVPALSALAGCAAPPVGDGVYPLRPRQSVALTPDTTLTYDSVSDSRCPANARCIRAGRLTFRFTIGGPGGSEAFDLGPDRSVAAPAALHGARVALDMHTVPRAGDAIPVTVTVSIGAARNAVPLPSTHPTNP